MNTKQASDVHTKGRELFKTKKFKEAIQAFREAIILEPNPVYYQDLAACYDLMGKSAKAAETLQKAVGSYQLAKSNLGALIDEDAPQTSQGDPRFYSTMNSIKNKIVPYWHFPMLNETERNEAYKEAIDKTVKEGDIVLDVGSGTGLLAMLAVKAGAKHVYTCEVVPEIAVETRKIIELNGMSDTITVINKHSTEIQIPEDVPQKADVFVSELINGPLLDEDATQSLRDVVRLLKDDARYIPRKGSVRTALVGGKELEHWTHAPEKIFGLSVSPFNNFRPLKRKLERHMEPDMLSDFTDIYTVDFENMPEKTESRQLTFAANQDGRAIGLAQWIHLDLADGVVFENRPPKGRFSHWPIDIYTLPKPKDVNKGDEISFDLICRFPQFWFNPK